MRKRAIYLTDWELEKILVEQTLTEEEMGEPHPDYAKAIEKLEREAAIRGIFKDK